MEKRPCPECFKMFVETVGTLVYLIDLLTEENIKLGSQASIPVDRVKRKYTRKKKRLGRPRKDGT